MNSPTVTARMAGILYVVVFFAAMFGPIYVLSTLVTPGNATATVSSITASMPLFKAGIASYLVIFVTEIALTVLLYVLFKPVNNTLSLMAAGFRIAMTIIHSVMVLSLFLIVALLSGADYLAMLDPSQTEALAMFFVDAHSIGWSIGILVFSFHVLGLGYLVFESGYMPKVLGLLLMLASASYLVDSALFLFVPAYTTTPIYLALFIVGAELAFPIWLLVKGVNIEGWNKLVRQPV